MYSVHRRADTALIRELRLQVEHLERERRRLSLQEPVLKDATRFLVHRGWGKYDVVEGWVLNDVPLTKDEARALVDAV